MGTSRADFLQEMESIPGWLDSLDASLICALSDYQHSNDLIGDIVEIGVFHGRSAILLGYLLAEGEHLIACDPFGAEAGMDSETALWNRRFYPGLRRQQFEANYLRYHGQLPARMLSSSDQLTDAITPGSCRLIHIDGAHDYATVRRDALMSRALCAQLGIVIFDDYCKAHLPGTAMAVWEQVACEGLVPIALTDAKLYASWGPEHAAIPADVLVQHASDLAGVRVDQHVLAQRVVPRIVPRRAPAAWHLSN